MEFKDFYEEHFEEDGPSGSEDVREYKRAVKRLYNFVHGDTLSKSKADQLEDILQEIFSLQQLADSDLGF